MVGDLLHKHFAVDQTCKATDRPLAHYMGSVNNGTMKVAFRPDPSFEEVGLKKWWSGMGDQ